MLLTTALRSSCRSLIRGLPLLLAAALGHPTAWGQTTYWFTNFVGMPGGPGDVGGAGSAARFSSPVGVAVDSAGNVYAADTYNSTIRKVTAWGVVTTLAGLAGTEGSADGTGSAARFGMPRGVAVDGAGNVYVADSGNCTIRKVTAAGVVTTLAGLAGPGGWQDGTGGAARFSNPGGVAVDSAGNVYVADKGNNSIRKVTAAGVVTTLAGSAEDFYGSVDGTGSAARFNYPCGVVVDSAGNVYVADSGNCTIRKVTAAGVVTTLAGLPGNSGSEDGTGSAARFNLPSGVAVDSAGNVYVADWRNNTIRLISPAGVVTTIGGTAGRMGSADGIGPAAQFARPFGIALDTAGNIYVADQLNNRISKGTTVTATEAYAAGSYPAVVLTNQPMAYWQLNDTGDPSTGTAVVLDSSPYALNGTYATNAMDGFNSIEGPRPPDFPGFSATDWAMGATSNTIQSFATVPLGSLSTNQVTLTAWVYLNGGQSDWTGFLESRDAVGLQGGLGMGGSGESNAGMLVYTWNDNNADTYGFVSGLTIPLNQWSFVAVAIAPTEATLYLGYVDTNAVSTLLSAVNTIPHTPDAFGTSWQIGADECCGDGGRTLNGSIAQVAVFGRTMSGADITALFAAGLGITSVAPAITQSPASVTVYAGLTVTLTSMATGSSPLSYQWYQGSVALTDGGNISGSKTAILTLSNMAATNAGNYKVVVTNPSGSASSSVATLAVQPRSSSAYEAAVLSLGPLAYWRLNETSDPSSGSVVAYDYVGGYDGTYGTNALNGFNGITGPRPTNGFAMFEADNDALETTDGEDLSCVTAPQPALNVNTATFTLWVYPIGAQADWTGLFMNRSTDGEGVGMGGSGEDNAGMLTYTWNGNSSDTYGFVSDLTIPQNQWSMVAVAIAPTQAILYLLNTNGVQTATNAIPQTVEAWGGTASIGIDPGWGNSRDFNGAIDEVAMFNYTLTLSQVHNLYAGISQVSPVPRPTLTISPSTGGKLSISWSGPGTLQSTPAIQLGESVWTNVGTNNPTILTPTGTAEFYRVLAP